MEQIAEDEVMRQIKFSVPGQPFGKQRPKFSRAGQYVKTYTPDKTVSYENSVTVFLSSSLLMLISATFSNAIVIPPLTFSFHQIALPPEQDSM